MLLGWLTQRFASLGICDIAKRLPGFELFLVRIRRAADDSKNITDKINAMSMKPCANPR